MQRYAILLADWAAEKKTKHIFREIRIGTDVSKGELLVAVAKGGHTEYTNLCHYHLEKDQAFELCAEDDSISDIVAPLTDDEFKLLEIASLSTRYELYTSGRCTWGSGLNLNDPVNVTVSVNLQSDGQSTPVQASAIIRYIGEPDGYCGTMFGVEIVDERYPHSGNTNGMWQGKRLFECKYNSGLFVSLEMISEKAKDGNVQIEVTNTPQESAENSSPLVLKQSSTSSVVSLDSQQSATQSTASTSQGKTSVAPCVASHQNEEEPQKHPDFEDGSLVQVINPPLYGVIRMMGTVPKIQGMAAGIELEEYRKGCTDGTWCKERYFNCPPGRGFFCSVSNLKPDQRFTEIEATPESYVNPLKDYPLEEPEDQPINISGDQLVKYLGEGRGIQGHYNSCYLDATVFGLFALSDAFDPMLQTEARDPAGEEIRGMLWRGIVNPLRKNGTARHESVMKLRNKLEELGKIKRVNQDEKDPEEFLNMLFKHALSAEFFISIKRPFGIEEEFFVQLFLEPDESLALPPTVGQLLQKMFKEQNISFTKAPDKLLIQIPRYGKQFKTFEKVIPTLHLDVVDLIEPLDCCLICDKPAWNKCSECDAAKELRDDQPTYFCDSCCSRVHSGCSDVPGSTDIHCSKEVADGRSSLRDLQLLSVICIETSHYVCFTRSIVQNQWVFFDSMADRVYNEYNIPKGVDCTKELNEWVYIGDKQLQSTPYRRLPELVRRFTHDIYLCVYISAASSCIDTII